MNETKKMRSIARNINRSWVAGLFAAFLLFDILAAGLTIGGWCYFQETKTGAEFSLKTPRHFETIDADQIPEEHQGYAQRSKR